MLRSWNSRSLHKELKQSQTSHWKTWHSGEPLHHRWSIQVLFSDLFSCTQSYSLVFVNIIYFCYFFSGKLENVYYNNDTFINVTFRNMFLTQVTFDMCLMKHVTFQNVTARQSHFIESTVEKSSFNDTTFYPDRFHGTKFDEYERSQGQNLLYFKAKLQVQFEPQEKLCPELCL